MSFVEYTKASTYSKKELPDVRVSSYTMGKMRVVSVLLSAAFQSQCGVSAGDSVRLERGELGDHGQLRISKDAGGVLRLSVPTGRAAKSPRSGGRIVFHGDFLAMTADVPPQSCKVAVERPGCFSIVLPSTFLAAMRNGKKVAA
jgi:hypothetical protein